MSEIFTEIKSDLSRIKDYIPVDLPYRQGALHDIKCYERLLELADHGINGKQVQHEFNINYFHIVDRKTGLTSGNMIGECPGVFKEWTWNQRNMPCLKNLDDDCSHPSWHSVVTFFGINGLVFDHLFNPHRQNKDYTYKNYCQLTKNSTKKEVCENMLDYLQYNIAKINQHLFD